MTTALCAPVLTQAPTSWGPRGPTSLVSPPGSHSACRSSSSHAPRGHLPVCLCLDSPRHGALGCPMNAPVPQRTCDRGALCRRGPLPLHQARGQRPGCVHQGRTAVSVAKTQSVRRGPWCCLRPFCRRTTPVRGPVHAPPPVLGRSMPHRCSFYEFFLCRAQSRHLVLSWKKCARDPDVSHILLLPGSCPGLWLMPGVPRGSRLGLLPRLCAPSSLPYTPGPPLRDHGFPRLVRG